MKLLCLFLLCASSLAETNIVVPLLKIGDASYTNATLRKVDPRTVIIRHDGGFGGSLAITNLPEPYRSNLFDPEEAARADKIAGIKAQREAARMQSVATAAAEVSRTNAWERLKTSERLRVEKIDDRGIFGTITHTIQIRGAPRLTAAQRAGAYTSGLGMGPVIGTRKEERGRIMVLNGPSGVADGQEIDIYGWQLGTTNINGGTLELWTCKTPAGYPPPPRH